MVRSFQPCDRYVFDFELCTAERGFAQIDTSQDAFYYGMWCNPFERKVVTYAEGDIVTTTLDTDAEFIKEIREIEKFEVETMQGKCNIDALCVDSLITRFHDLGLEDLLH
jgi:hypothetical protein